MFSKVQQTLDNPLRAFRDIDRVLNHVWDSVEQSASTAGFPVDILDQDDTLVVTAELPGFEKDQIDISIEQGTLSIKADRKALETDGKVHVHERRATQFARRFTLPKAYDTQTVDATLTNGLLTLKLPKREESKPHKIVVK